MHPVRMIGLTALLRSALLLTLIAAASGAGLLSESENSFLNSTRASMRTMMTDMQISARGDVDQDFIGQMIPHHRGAIEMAKAELLYGHNERLHRIAQEIIVEQRAEIAVMQREQVSRETSSVRVGGN
jgi:uncharacterized protein (DUF305 family)